MKVFFKGCMWIVVLIIVLIIGLVFYSNSPNEIEFASKPLTYKEFKKEIQFESNEIPEYIEKVKEEDILYQALLSSYSMDKKVVFKQIINIRNKIKLSKSLPIKSSDLKIINDNSYFTSVSEGLVFEIPNSKELPSGNSLRIFSLIDDIELNLKKGSYSIFYDEIDKDGALAEILIYDEKSKLLFFTRTRYFAFQ